MNELRRPSISHAWRSYPRRSADCHRGGMRYSTPSLAGMGMDTLWRMGRAFHARTSRNQSHPVLAPPRAYASVRMRRFRSCWLPWGHRSERTSGRRWGPSGERRWQSLRVVYHRVAPRLLQTHHPPLRLVRKKICTYKLSIMSLMHQYLCLFYCF